MLRPTLVTGAAGFSGSHLVDLLAGQGANLVAWHRPGGHPHTHVTGVTWQAVDLLDRDAVRDAVGATRPAHVYHCAGAAHVGQSWDQTVPSLSVNARGTHHLVEAMRHAVPDARLMIPSSALVYAPSTLPLSETHAVLPASPYGLSKLAQELVGQGNEGGPQVCIARPFNHIGPRQDPGFAAPAFARRIAEAEVGRGAPEIAVGNLEPLRDLTDVRDTVRAYQLILERGTPGRVYNVCTGRVVRISALLDMLLARARVPIRIVVDPARYRPNDVPVVQGDPARIREELGWSPVVPLEQTIDDLLTFWRMRVEST
jgi:GDP-4-dehydro-6-deoxy-D-mannose reductase